MSLGGQSLHRPEADVPKIVRINFEKGVYGQAEPRIAGDGYAAILHNCDTRSGVIRPMKAPVADSSVTAETGYSFSGAKCLFEFQGHWYPTAEQRDWAAEKYGTVTRLYFTTQNQGHISVLPQKVVNGTQAKLGIKPPSSAPTVASYQASTTTAPAMSLAKVDKAVYSSINAAGIKKGGNYHYACLVRGANGKVLALSTPTLIFLPDDDKWVVEITADVTGVDAGSRVEYYRSPSAEDAGATVQAMYYLNGASAPVGGVSPTGVTAVDTGNSIDLTKPFPTGTSDASLTPVRYFYTYTRDVNGMEDESGPSDPSESIEMGVGRIVSFESVGSGEFVPDPTKSFASPVATKINYSSSVTSQTIITAQGVSTISFSAAHSLANGARVVLVNTGNSADPVNGPYQVTVPAAAGTPRGVTVALETAGSGLAAGTYTVQIVGVVGTSAVSVGGYLGAKTLPSSAVSITVPASGSTLRVSCEIDPKVDLYLIHINGKYGGDSFTPSAGYGVATVYNAGGHAVPGANTTATHAVKVNAILVPNDGSGSSQYRLEVGTGAKITTAAHGFAAGTKRSVRLTGFTTNTALNGTFVSTVVDATNVSVNAYMSSSPETGTLAEFALSSGGGGGSDDVSAYKDRKLYRIGDVNNYQLVARVSLDEDSYTDTVPTEDLGEISPTYYTDNGLLVIYAPPPEDLEKQISSHGILVGISGNQIRWTPVNAPDAWPEVFSINLDSKPTNLRVVGGSVVIFTRNYIGRLEMTGGPAASYYQKTNSEVGCIAPYSIQSTPKGIVFLADDGIYIFDPGRNTSYPIFPNRMGRRFFLSPSAGLTWGHWWYPSNRSFQYNFLTRDLPGKKVTGMVNQLDTISLYPDPFLSVRSFYTHGKYFLFYPNDSNYANHVMLRVDLEGPVPVADFVGIHPVVAWVTEGGNPYLTLGATSGASLATVMALEGTDPTVASGATLNESGATLWRFMDELGPTGVASVRTGPMAAVNHERVQWGFVDVHGSGRGTARIWVDGWEVTSGGACTFVASETPTGARRIPIPRGALGYTIDVEVQGMDKLIALEIGFVPPEEFEP